MEIIILVYKNDYFPNGQTSNNIFYSLCNIVKNNRSALMQY